MAGRPPRIEGRLFLPQGIILCWWRAADCQRKRPEPEQSCRRTASRMLAQDVPGPFFPDLADSIIDYAQWQRPASTVDKKPVFPNHATALRKCGIFRLRREFSLHELLKVVFHRQPCAGAKAFSAAAISGFNPGSWDTSAAQLEV